MKAKEQADYLRRILFWRNKERTFETLAYDCAKENPRWRFKP